jgi:putative ABC transport system substrate-binding protein
LVAKAVTTTIPIVFGTGVDPVEIGLVESLNRPGGNVTGFSNFLAHLASKQFGLFHELVPKAGRFGALVDQGNPLTKAYIKDLQEAAAAAIGRQVEILPVRGSRDIELAFAALAQKQIDGLLIGPTALFGNRRVQLVTLATHYRLPTMYLLRDYVENGGLMSYGPSNDDS